ncbi:MAG: hypothetical protein R2795_12780 [Saprospiraceae bacterium]
MQFSHDRYNPAGIRNIFLLYIALLLGQILFSFVVIFLITQPDKVLTDGSPYTFLGLLVVFLSAGAAWFVNNLRVQQAAMIKGALADKLMHYRTSIVMRSAMVEAGNLFCVVLALLTSSLTPFLFFCLGLGVFLFFRPQLDEVNRVYQLSLEEQRTLEQQLRRRI